jgi:hypothetical protein
MSVIFGLAAISIMLAAPVKAQRGKGSQGGTHVCNSGHHAKNPKACKENGGHL